MFNGTGASPRRVARLVRVSTTHLEQADSPQHQLAYMDEQIHRMGLVDSGCTYRAELTGALVLDRPDIKRLLDDAQAGTYDVVMVKSVSRLGRDTLGLLTVKRVLDDLGIELMAPLDGYCSFRDPELIFMIHADRAQSGRQEIAKNVRAGIAQAARRGIWPAGTLPFGLRKLSRYDVEHDPETAPIVLQIFDLRRQQLGYTEICRRLNTELKIPGPGWWTVRQQLDKLTRNGDMKDERVQTRIRGMEKRLQYGRFIWYPKTLRIILENTAYYGELRYNRTTGKRQMRGKLTRSRRAESEWILINCPPLVSKADWDEAQAVAKIHERLQGKAQTSSFLLSGLAFCGHCGGTLRTMPARRNTGSRGGEVKGTYVCRASVESGLHKAEYVRASVLEAKVVSALRDDLQGLSIPSDMVQAKRKPTGSGRKRLDALERELDELPEARYFRREQLRKGLMTEEEFSQELAIIQKREAHLVVMLERERRGQQRLRDEELKAVAVREAIQRLARLDGDDQQTKHLLAVLVERVIVHSKEDIEVRTTYTPDELHNLAAD